MKIVEIAKKKIFSGHEQSIELKKNIVYSIGVKLLAMTIGIVYLPTILRFVDKASLGLVMTIDSIISWIYLSDIGIGNGFKNKFNYAISVGDHEKAKSLTSTAYITLFSILLVVLIIVNFIAGFINWNSLFKVDINPKELLLGVRFAIFALLLSFGLKLINNLIQAFQLNYLNNIVSLIIKIVNLLAIIIAIHLTTGSFLKYIIIDHSVPLIILTIFSILLFNTKFKYYKPSFKYFKFSEIKNITSLGFKFFLIQITAMILFSTDNMIITRLFNTSDVTVYNVIRRYYLTVWTFFTFISIPLWPAYTKAYARKDFDWIRRITKKILRISFFLSAIIVLMLIFYKPVIKFWLRGKIEVPLMLSVFMALSQIIMLIASPFVSFINGTGKLKLSLTLAPFSAILNIPLSVFFAKYLNMGIAGVILATSVCNGLSLLFSSIQYNKIINNKATGIWNA